MAENIHRIATRYLSQHDVSLAEATVDGWANSETHLRNIRNERLNAIGVGIAKGVNAAGEESWYCVQLFLYDGCVISQVDILLVSGVHDPVLSGATNRFLSENRKPIDRIS